MLTFQQAWDCILARGSALPSEVAPIDEALGRVLAEDVRAARLVPPFDNSAMDGYAVRAEDVGSAPTRLRVADTVHAGETAKRGLETNEAVRVMTGAPLPRGANAVVMQEKTRRDGDLVEVLEAAAFGQFVRPAGEDARPDEVLLPRGAGLGVPELCLLASQGFTRAPVRRRPTVRIVTSGDELAPLGSQDPSRLVDTNSWALAKLCQQAGATAHCEGIARDSAAALRELLEAALARPCDVLLCVGGMSVGERDFTRKALEDLGARFDFWRVAIKPGKPLAFGHRASTVVFGLPGNPASALVTFELFVRPLLARLQGVVDPLPTPVPATLAEPLSKPEGLAHFPRVQLGWHRRQLVCRPLPTQNSGSLRSLTKAHALLHLPLEKCVFPEGSEVEVFPVGWSLQRTVGWGI